MVRTGEGDRETWEQAGGPVGVTGGEDRWVEQVGGPESGIAGGTGEG